MKPVNSAGMVLPKDFYIQKDVVLLARKLIGKVLYTQFNKQLTAGIITETEAYAGIADKASHAYNGRRTKRTSTMYLEGGVSYVYLCYGIHALFNVVTNTEQNPDAVLIRGIFPYCGQGIMKKRYKNWKHSHRILVGPGVVTKVLGIGLFHNAQSLLKKANDCIWIEDSFPTSLSLDIQTGKRIGIDYAEEDAGLPYRFWIEKDELSNLLKTKDNKIK